MDIDRILILVAIVCLGVALLGVLGAVAVNEVAFLVIGLGCIVVAKVL